jgi:hypothetical protein
MQISERRLGKNEGVCASVVHWTIRDGIIYLFNICTAEVVALQTYICATATAICDGHFISRFVCRESPSLRLCENDAFADTHEWHSLYLLYCFFV